MQTIKLRGRSAPDGLLKLEVPIDSGAGEVDVTVTVEKTRPPTDGPPRHMESSEGDRVQRERELLELARQWPRFEADLPVALRAITEAGGRALVVARTSIWRFSADRQLLHCDDLFDIKRNSHAGDDERRADTCPAYFRAVETDDLIVAEEANRDTRTSELAESYLAPSGIGAMLDAPIRVGGRAIGVLCHEHVGSARRWSLGEQKDARFLAGLTSLAFEGAERRVGEQKLAHSLSLLRATLEATADGIMTVDLEGVITSYNQRFLGMWQVTPQVLAGPPVADRLRAFSAKCADPADFRERIAKVFANPAMDAVAEISMLDGRAFQAHVRPQWMDQKIVGRVFSFRDITQQKAHEAALRENEARLQELVTLDTLTGLFNRRHTLERLEDEIKRSARYSQVFTVALLDLDHFKDINDTYGHLVGDAVLRGFGRELATRLRDTDVVGRFGGEEFLIVFLGAPSVQARAALADIRARRGSSSPTNPPYTFSGGLAEFPTDGASAEDLIRRADVRLYEAKRSGRDRVV